MNIAYRFFVEDKGEIISKNGTRTVWKPGEWLKHDGELALCAHGYHASPTVYDALKERQGEVFGKVEWRGKLLDGTTKFCCEEMRIICTYPREALVELAICAAQSVLAIYEQKHPDDKRPRKAIDAAIEYVKNPTDENREAVHNAAAAADDAADDAAAYAAYAAAYAAYAAYAANATYNAAHAADSAYAAAADSAYANAARKDWREGFEREAGEILKRYEAAAIRRGGEEGR